MDAKVNGHDKRTRCVTTSREWWLDGLIGCQAGLYAYISLLSRRFEFTSEFQQRPIVQLLLLLTADFVLHFWSLRLALRSADHAAITRRVLLGALLFRALLLPSLPIQEVDLYRYLWDGSVVANGQNPYCFSPQQVLSAARTEQIPSSLESLVERREQSNSLQETLHRIHFGELITVYPPVSQAVFGLASLLVPDQASLYQRVLTMKVVLTLFDLMTVCLLFALLRHVGQHPAWAILYAWSPLVLKECANSGHLDSIAVFLTTAAVLCLIYGVAASKAGGTWWLTCSALLLGLGVGAKLYPIILLPVLAVWAVRKVGWRIGIVYAPVALLCAVGSLAPMLLTEAAPSALQSQGPPGVPLPSGHTAAGSGLTTFLSRWEINDLAFLVIVENLRPDPGDAGSHWFVVLPNTLRGDVSQSASTIFRMPVSEATFLTARIITMVLFGVLVVGMLWCAVQRNEQDFWLRTVFLTLAWFWVLAPTQNPWYWTWALPFLPFAGRRTWCLVSLLALAYYLRFWLLYQFPDANVAGTGYQGEEFFHFVVAPLEHGFWMLLLLGESMTFRQSVSAFTEGNADDEVT